MNCIFQWWDIIVFIVLSIVHIVGWIEIKEKLNENPKNDVKSREFGATSLNNASVAGITAVSILIPASLLIIQLGSNQSSGLPGNVLEFVFRASLWFLFSLASGLILVFLVPMRSQEYNVARDLVTGIPFGPQLLALLIGMIWLVYGIYKTVYC